jgi:hypothetical protein
MRVDGRLYSALTATYQPTGEPHSSMATRTGTSTPPSLSPSAGVTVGRVVGALGGVTLIAAVVLPYRRKQRRARRVAAVQEEYLVNIGQPNFRARLFSRKSD